MNMLEFLGSTAPVTTARFINSMMFEFGISEQEYLDMDYQKRLKEVFRWFGYPTVINKDMTRDDVKNRLQTIFSDYEELIHKYPTGMIDPLKIIKNMDYKQRMQYQDEKEQRLINICLHHAIVLGYSLIRPSLKDSITERLLSEEEKVEKFNFEFRQERDTFWKDTITNFNANEIAPF